MNDPSHQLSLQGTVIAVACDSEHKFSKPTKNQITTVAGYGVEGDAHAGEFIKHRYLMKNKPQLSNNRQVHIIAGELFEEVSLQGFKVTAGQLGENVTTKGLELGKLPLGTLLHLGPSSVVELTGLRTPCSLIDRFQKGLKRAMIGPKTDRSRFRCGVLGIVRQSGAISVGDAVRATLPALPWQDLPVL
jgi:MOSC domain-containing protein YiiM